MKRDPLPPFGMAKIKCGARKCDWLGTERDLVEVAHKKIAGAKQMVCPSCGCDSYHFAKGK